MAFFDKLGETLVNASKDVSQKAKDLSGTAKLTLDIRSKEDQVQKLYTEIGRRYFDEHKEDDPVMYDEMGQVKELLTAIEDMKKEMLDLKGAKVCPRCGAEVQAQDAYCKSCGAKMEDDDIVVDAVVKEAPEEPVAENEEATAETAGSETADKEITEEAFEE